MLTVSWVLYILSLLLDYWGLNVEFVSNISYYMMFVQHSGI